MLVVVGGVLQGQAQTGIYYDSAENLTLTLYMNLKVNSCNMGTIGLKSPLTIVKYAIGLNH